MDSNPDEVREFEFNRAAVDLIQDIRVLVNTLIWKTTKDGQELHRYARKRHLYSILGKIETFQEDSQLLDGALQEITSQVASAYLISSGLTTPNRASKEIIPLSEALSKILYILCKVRGDKVIVRLLNNEPKYLEPLLSVLEALQTDSTVWEERFVLLLWISHLLLAPFDLSSISSTVPTSIDETIISLPNNTPSIARRIVPICLYFLPCPSREKLGAARLLSRLCLRPDMCKIGLLDTIVNWAITSVQDLWTTTEDLLHRGLGLLYFLSYLVASGSKDEISNFTVAIYSCCQLIQTDPKYQTLRSSANIQKLLIKINRNLVLMALHAEIYGLDPDDIVPEFIDLLLQSLENSDSVVRMAASKTLSILTQQLDPEIAEDVFHAIIESFQENVIGSGIKADYSAVNPLKWHGLTLTLSHLLYRRAIPPTLLPEILIVLILALNFEQRSAVGNSVGTNVRDAANYGIWSVARRYKTDELLSVAIDNFRSIKSHVLASSIIQILAIELLRSSCFDPAGNVRRGSSAALQELIGRHPNTVEQGIDLTQTIDYHVVALLKNSVRAAADAAELSEMYWWAVYDAIFGWRGAKSLEENTRMLMSDTVFYLTNTSKYLTPVDILQNIGNNVAEAMNYPEFWHGLSYMATGCLQRISNFDSKLDDSEIKIIVKAVEGLLPSTSRIYEAKSSISRLLAIVNIKIQHELAICLERVSKNSESSFHYAREQRNFGICTDTCLRRFEGDELDSFLSLKINPMESIALLDADFENKQKSWLQELDPHAGRASPPGIVLACGASASMFPAIQEVVIRTVSLRCTPIVDVDSRVYALKALQFALLNEPLSQKLGQTDPDMVLEALKAALNDHTVTQRGDVGSQVRIAALNTLRLIQDQVKLGTAQNTLLVTSIIPLALEKLDRVRESAWGVHMTSIELPMWNSTPTENSTVPNQSNSEKYFEQWLEMFQKEEDNELKESIILGFCSSAGGGSEVVVQNSRSAFVKMIDPQLGNGGVNFSKEFLHSCRNILSRHFKNDRIAIPLLELLGFVADTGVFKELQADSSLKWKTLLSLVQKSHYQSGNVSKIIVALQVYSGLADVESVRGLVLNKLRSMLVHNYTKVRIETAETLMNVLRDDILKKILIQENWSKAKSDLKATVDRIDSLPLS